MFNVLLVDDMDIVRLEVKRLSLWGEKSGFVIAGEARNGHEALLTLEKNKFDMVITDIRMPKIDGIELLKNIVEKSMCHCVVLLSDFSEFSYARQGIILGAFDYMSKPICETEVEKMLERAKQYIEQRQQEAEHVRALEQALEKKSEEYFQPYEITEIVELIQNRDLKAMSSVTQIIERLGVENNYDSYKFERILKKALYQTLSKLIENNEWLEKFVDTSALNSQFFIVLSELTDMIDFCNQNIRNLINILNRLQYGYQEKGVVWQACNYILANVDGELSLSIVADKLYMNRTYLSQAFKQKTGISFIEYLTMVKMERAMHLISAHNMKSYEVAEKLGYIDPEYFSKIFKKYTGVSPAQFRRKS